MQWRSRHGRWRGDGLATGGPQAYPCRGGGGGGRRGRAEQPQSRRKEDEGLKGYGEKERDTDKQLFFSYHSGE